MRGSRSCQYSAMLWIVVLFVVSVESGPLNIEGPSREVSNNSLVEFDSSLSKGCRYKGLRYSNYEEVSTDEPCLACQCKGTAVVCKLRICPEIPVNPPPGCIVLHKAKSCCSQLICHGQEHAKKISREQRFPAHVSSESFLSSASNETKEPTGYCVLDGTVYAEGSAMRSSTLCQYCFCIRGEMKCSEPQCVIPLKGCNPQFRSYACCPTNYDCGQSNETAILKTLPSSTQVPQFLKGCLVNGQFVPEGEPVLPVQLAGFGSNASSSNVCQTCFCMGGVVHCRPLECDHPIDGCTPIMEDGHCCPDRYDCSKLQETSSTPKVTITMITTDDTSMSSETTEMTQQISDLPYTSPDDETTLLISNSARQADPSSISATTVVSVYDEMDSTTSTNEDSFERIASSVMSGSSEESTVPSVTHPTRVPSPTFASFRNRSDLGSREERRSKVADEIAQKHSIEDDEKEEFAYQTLETTVSNAIEELAATTIFDDVVNDSTQDPDIDGSVEAETTSVNNLSVESVTGHYTSEEEDLETTTNHHHNSISDEDVSIKTHFSTEEILPHFSTEEVKSEEMPVTTPISTTTTHAPSEPTSAATTESTTTSTTTQPPPPSTTTKEATTTPPTTSTAGNLEFIPFVEEDARVSVSSNESVYGYNDENSEANSFSSSEAPMEFVPLHTPPDINIPVLKPLELKYFNGSGESSKSEVESLEDALPIIVEKDIEMSHNFNVTSFIPVSTSLYSNGYYPHGDIIKDDGPADELIVSQGELNEPVSNKRRNDKIENFDDSANQVNNFPNQVPSQVRPTLITKSTLSTTKTTAKPQSAPSPTTTNPRDKFIPSYSLPPNMQHTNSPTRTYSKFGMQDSPLYRYDHGSLDNNGFPFTPNPPEETYHHRYYNEPEELPPARLQNSYNYYNTFNNNNNNNKESKPYRGQGAGMLPPMYKDNQFFYEDSSAAMESYEDYEPYFQASHRPPTPPTQTPVASSTKTSSSSGSSVSSSTQSPSSIKFLGERVRLPTYNQQRGTSTPKYKYAYLNNNKVTPQTKPTTERATTKSDFKPLAQFPFSLPRNQDNLYNMGIKLSGCNVVGKMYSVGEVIEELSSDCLRCMCDDNGVHCVELKC